MEVRLCNYWADGLTCQQLRSGADKAATPREVRSFRRDVRTCTVQLEMTPICQPKSVHGPAAFSAAFFVRTKFISERCRFVRSTTIPLTSSSMGLLTATRTTTARSMALATGPMRQGAPFSSSSRAATRPPPGKLNKYSGIITAPKDQGASQAMLYATPGIESEEDLSRAMVGVASVWYVLRRLGRFLSRFRG